MSFFSLGLSSNNDNSKRLWYSKTKFSSYNFTLIIINVLKY